MAGRRMIHDKIWSSRNNLHLTLRQRLLFIGLFTCADDQGRVDGHPGLLKSEIFKFDEFTTEEIAADLDAIEATGAIIKYSQNGMDNIQLSTWWEYQKLQWAQPSDFPAPDDWQDRIRYQHKGEILTYNWTSPAGDESEDTCDAAGQPLPNKPPKKQGRSLPSDPPSGLPEGIRLKDLKNEDIKTTKGDKKASPDGEERPTTEWNKKRNAIRDYFCEITGILPPDEKAADTPKMWFSPIIYMLKTCDKDVDKAEDVMQGTLKRMDDKGWPIANPNAMKKTFTAIVGERKRGVKPQVNGESADGSVIIGNTSPIPEGKR